MRTYDNILTEIKATLRLTDTTDHDSMLKVMMNNAIKAMNIKEAVTLKNAVAPIKNGRAKLPEDFVSLVAVRLPDCSQVTYFEQPYINDCQDCTDALPSLQAGQVVGGWFVFNSALSNEATEANFAYIATNADEDGLIIMKDEYANPIKWGVAMEFGNSFPEMYPERSVHRWERLYVAAAGALRGRQQVRNFKDNREYIKLIMNSLLSDNRSVFQFAGLARRTTHYTEINSAN